MEKFKVPNSYVHNTSHRCWKLDPRANKNVFIRYFDYLKGYVMYCEHPMED